MVGCKRPRHFSLSEWIRQETCHHLSLSRSRPSPENEPRIVRADTLSMEHIYADMQILLHSLLGWMDGWMDDDWQQGRKEGGQVAHIFCPCHLESLFGTCHTCTHSRFPSISATTIQRDQTIYKNQKKKTERRVFR